jgi:hypothetical protein
LLSSFLKIKVPRGKSFGIQTLSPDDLDYKIIKTAFETTQKHKFNKNNSNQNDYNYKIVKIQKIYNPNIMDKFSSELKRCLRKYPRTRVYDLLQLLFHGTKSTKPIEIYASEFGLDNRFA